MDLSDCKLPSDKKGKRKKKPTLRFELDLPGSTDTSCPEYSFVDLVRKTLKERESKGQNDPLCQNMLEEEEEKERKEAKAIAEYFEIKYGAIAAGQKRKRKDKARDLVGAGYGYDGNDPFVDDSEDYDEIVPATLTTQHGGFYINTGKLNFKTVSDDSDTGSASDDSMPLSQHAAKKKKKRLIALDSAESEDEFKKVGVKQKKKKLKSSNPEKKRLKMSLNGKDRVTGLKQRSKKIKKPTSLAQKLVAKAKAQQMMNASSATSLAHTSNGAVLQFRKSLPDEMPPSMSKFGELGLLENKDLALVAKQVTKELMSVGVSEASPNDNAGAEVENGLSNGVNATSSTAKATPTANHELPPNLPQMLGDKIDSLKKIAKSTEDAGKMKFFSSDVNRILLGIEESAQCLRNKERQGMYQHIAQHLPCSKDTLLKRVKKLQEDDSDQQLRGPIEQLKNAVNAVMTSQIEAYILGCDSNRMEKLPDKAAMAASTDEDDEGEEKGADTSGEKGKRTYAPRRKFKWDDNLRKLLCDVVSVKMSFYERFKFREKQSADEYLKAFLESTIKPLWPKPWMQTRNLFKESRSAHERWTNNCQKPKKAGSNKKVIGIGKDLSIQRADTTKVLEVLLSPVATQSENKTPKKQLSFDTPPASKPSQSSFKPTVDFTGDSSNLKRNGAHDVATSGGFELMATIEGEDFKPSPKSTPQSSSVAYAISKEPKPSWKNAGVGNSNLGKSGGKSRPVPLMSMPGTSLKAERKVDAKVSKPSNRKSDPPPMTVDSKIMQEYASDFVKLMMSASPRPQGPAGYMGMPGFSDYDTISKILGLKCEDVLPKAITSNLPSSSDEKFQFKIASDPVISSSRSNRSTPARGFMMVDPGRKHLPTLANSAWTTQKSGVQKTPPEKIYSSAQSVPARSAPSMFSDGQSAKKSSAQSCPFVSPRFIDSSFNSPQQRSSAQQSINYEQSSHKVAANIMKQAAPLSNVKRQKQSPPMALPMPRQHHHQMGGVPKSPVDPNHPGLAPMGLPGTYSASNLGNSFQAAFSSPLSSPYSAAPKFQPPVSPVHNYPTASVASRQFAGHPFAAYPQLKHGDLRGSSQDFVKQSNLNLKGNQTR